MCHTNRVHLGYNSKSYNGNNVATNSEVEKTKYSRNDRPTTVQTSADIFPAIAPTLKGII